MEIQVFFLQQKIELGLDYIKDCIESVESYTKNSLIQLQQKENKLKASNNVDALDDFYDAHEHQYFSLTQSLPSILRKSMVILLCSHVEVSLNLICNFEKNYKNLPKTISEEKDGQGIYRAHKYLKKYKVTDISEIPSWGLLREFSKLRNAIVHNDSWIYTQKENRKTCISDIDNLLQHEPRILVLNDGIDKSKRHVTLEAGILDHFISIIDSFFKDLFPKL